MIGTTNSFVDDILDRLRRNLGIDEYLPNSSKLPASAKLTVKFKKEHPKAQIPAKQTSLAAGADLYSIETVLLEPLVPTLVRTGLSMEMSKDLEAQVRSRSGLSLKGVVVFNSPGTIDADYRGEVKVILINFNTEPFKIDAGTRIAQMVIGKVPVVEFLETNSLTSTERGKGGFGSTGVA